MAQLAAEARRTVIEQAKISRWNRAARLAAACLAAAGLAVLMVFWMHRAVPARALMDGEFWLFRGMMVGYGAAFLFYLLHLWLRESVSQRFGRVATSVALLGLVGNAGTIIVRCARVWHLPSGDLYEIGLCFLLGAVGLYLVLEWQSLVGQAPPESHAVAIFSAEGEAQAGADIRPVGALVTGAALVLTLFLWRMFPDWHKNPGDIQPILKSFWRGIHPFLAVPGYGGLLVAFGAGAMYLMKQALGSRPLAARLPSFEALDEMSYKCVAIAFPFLTLLIITGALWAKVSWGVYWQWDPKETWAFVTWLFFASYLHTRLRMDWRGAKTAWLLVIGFAALLFTFLGVSFLPSIGGLHSYAKSE